MEFFENRKLLWADIESQTAMIKQPDATIALYRRGDSYGDGIFVGCIYCNTKEGGYLKNAYSVQRIFYTEQEGRDYVAAMRELFPNLKIAKLTGRSNRVI